MAQEDQDFALRQYKQKLETMYGPGAPQVQQALAAYLGGQGGAVQQPPTYLTGGNLADTPFVPKPAAQNILPTPAAQTPTGSLALFVNQAPGSQPEDYKQQLRDQVARGEISNTEAMYRGQWGANRETLPNYGTPENPRPNQYFIQPELESQLGEQERSARAAFDKYASGVQGRISPEIEAQLGARGFEVGGGAYNAALAEAMKGVGQERFNLENYLAQNRAQTGQQALGNQWNFAQQQELQNQQINAQKDARGNSWERAAGLLVGGLGGAGGLSNMIGGISKIFGGGGGGALPPSSGGYGSPGASFLPPSLSVGQQKPLFGGGGNSFLRY